MHIFSSFLFALSANIDCFTIGLSYGIRSLHIGRKSNIIISSFSTLGTYVSMKTGSYLTHILSIKFTNQIGSVCLIGFGLWILYQYFYQENSLIPNHDIQIIHLKETFIIAIFLTLNNMGLGIGGSITGLSIEWTCLFTFLLSFFFINISKHITKSHVSTYLSQHCSLLSGLLILCLGLYELYL